MFYLYLVGKSQSKLGKSVRIHSDVCWFCCWSW